MSVSTKWEEMGLELGMEIWAADRSSQNASTGLRNAARWSRGAWAQEKRAKGEEAVERDGPPDKSHAGDAGGMNHRGMRAGGVCETEAEMRRPRG